MSKNILLTIAYDGTGFHGWQRQPEELTVQGYLERTLSRLFKTEIVLNGTSRTDAGVHAYGQRASFRADISIPTQKLALVINNALCGQEKGSYAISPVRILKAEEMPQEFHARFDCRGKEYIYRIYNSQDIDIFRRNYCYHVRDSLDTAAMREAAQYLVGTHDFKAFESSGGNPRETTVRTVYSLTIEENSMAGPAAGTGISSSPSSSSPQSSSDLTGMSESAASGERELQLHVCGDGFLYNMVRIITGTLVDVGAGRMQPADVKAALAAGQRSMAGHTAPPYGLYLAHVFY